MSFKHLHLLAALKQTLHYPKLICDHFWLYISLDGILSPKELDWFSQSFKSVYEFRLLWF